MPQQRRRHFGGEYNDGRTPAREAQGYLVERINAVAPEVPETLRRGTLPLCRGVDLPATWTGPLTADGRSDWERQLVAWARGYNMAVPWFAETALLTLRWWQGGWEPHDRLIHVQSGLYQPQIGPPAWNPHRETEAEHGERMKDYYAAVRRDTNAAGRETRGWNQAERDFDLFVRYQVLGETKKRLAAFLTEADPTRREDPDSTFQVRSVENVLWRVAKRVQVPLRS